MNKKNKGFTLIEVLATIAIIAVVTLLATVTYTKVRSRLINKQYRNLKTIIEIAGVRYTSKTGVGLTIKSEGYYVQELIDEGYLDPDDETGNIYDPRDNHSLNCHLVRVYIDNGNYYAELGDISFAEKDGCQTQFKGDPELTLTAYIHGKDKNYLTTSDEFNKLLEKDSQDIYKNIDVVISKGLRWTNKQLDLTANINPNTAYYHDLREIKYVWNNDASSISENNTHTTSVQVLYTNPYTVEAITKDNKHLNAYVNYYFDRKPPEIKKGSVGYVNNDRDVWKKSKWIYFNITAEDDVGVDRIYAGKEPCSELKRNKKLGVRVSDVDSHKHVQTYEVKIEAGKDGENGEINICAIDKLGNIVSDDKTETFKIMKIDITKPHCTKELKAKRSNDVIGEHNKYQYASRTIRQYCYDNNMINGVLVVGSQCDPSETGGHTDGNYVYFQKTFGQNGAAIKTGYITIYDKVGWSTKCTVDAYVDRKGPLCSKKTGNTSLGQTKNGGSSETDGATTLGVGSVNNWDQRFRHITQYCYDENVGCRNNSESNEWDYNDGEIIRTAKIRIYDKVPLCSRKETVTSTNCANYDSIKNTNANLVDPNNHTDCTVGVYIDHLPPKAEKLGSGVHGGNRVKVKCEDPSWHNVEGSGIKSFTATARVNGGTEAHIAPCKSSPTNCDESYDKTQSNNTGAKLQFKITFPNANAQIPVPANNIIIKTTCTDNANNVDKDSNSNPYRELEFEARLDDSTQFGKKYINEIEGRQDLGPSNGCILKQYRETSEINCISLYSYDCARHDVACASESNTGIGSTCCLQGESPIYGCKSKSGWKSFGETNYIASEKYASSNEWYMEYNDGSGSALYVAPKSDDPNRGNCETIGEKLYCNGGYKCLHFNCYPDNPSVGNSQGGMYTWVCGNENK